MAGRDGLRVRVLGRLDACDGDAEIDLGGRRQRAVLAVLVLARGEVVPAERLADCVWGDGLPGNAAGAAAVLRVAPAPPARSPAARRARAAAESSPAPAPATPSGCRRDAVDAWRFEQLVRDAATAAGGDPRRAADLLTEALGLVARPGAAPSTPASRGPRPRSPGSTELRAVARERLLAARLEPRRGRRCSYRSSRRWSPRSRCARSGGGCWCSRCTGRTGRPTRWPRSAGRAALLADELGVDPGPALRALEAEVLAQSPALAPPGRRPAGRRRPRPGRDARPPRRLAPAPSRRRRPTWSTATRELGAIRHGGRRPRRRRPRAAAHRGPARHRQDPAARRGPPAGRRAAALPVLGARGSQLERDVRLRRRAAAVRARARRPRPARARCSPARPRARAAVFDVARTSAGGDGSFAVLHGLYWLTVEPRRRAAAGARGRRPAVVRHAPRCASSPTSSAGSRGCRVLVVATLRTGERHERRDAARRARRSTRATVAVRPGAADAARAARAGPRAARRARRRCSSPPATARPRATRCCCASCCARWRPTASAPDAAHADTVMRRRLARGRRAWCCSGCAGCRPSAAAVARAVAVLGERRRAAGRRRARRTSTRPRPRRALADLARAEILRDEHPLGFVHPLVRDAVYRDLPAAERALAHERAARCCAPRGAPAEQVAAHLLLAPAAADAATVEAAARGGAHGGRARARPRARSPTCAAPWTSRAEGPARPACCARSGLLETLVDGPAGARAPAAPPTPLRDGARRPGASWPSPSPGRTSSPARPASPPRSPGRPPPRCPASSPTRGRAWSPCSGSAASCTGSTRRLVAGRRRARRAGRRATAPGCSPRRWPGRSTLRGRPTGRGPSSWPGSPCTRTGCWRSTAGCSGWWRPTRG